MFIPYIKLIIGFIILIKCADWFVDGASSLAKALGISSLIIGLTVVAFGTSAPELAVSISAALSGQNDICIGNVTGSNICNNLLILGCAALIAPLKADNQIIKRDLPFMITAETMLLVMMTVPFLMGNSLTLVGLDGVILLAGIVIYLIKAAKDTNMGANEDAMLDTLEEKTQLTIKDVFFILVGLVGIVWSGDLVVDSAVEIATDLGLSTQLIALTIVAIGTSLPELVTSVVASKKRQVDIAIGNVIGSNIFNIFLIIGSSAAVCNVSYNVNTIIDAACVLTAGLITMLFINPKKNTVTRANGLVMVMLYFIFMTYIIIR